ncbi:MAG: RNA methyltransferase [Elusimicrobia bacterium]|nr:RNA methyltransferase [Elusimicrobiota bacterium]
MASSCRIEAVTSAEDPRLLDYAQAREPDELRRRGVFLAESREVVAALIRARRFGVRSLLLAEGMLASLEEELGMLEDTTPVFVAERGLMTGIVGYTVHRGCLAAGERGPGLKLNDLLTAPCAEASYGGPPEGVLPGSRLMVALEAVSNPDNVGGIFRNALAFGADGVVLGPGCADPLYRKAIRTSMAASLRAPFAAVPDLPGALRELRAAGFFVAALTSRKQPATELGDFAREARRERLVLVTGSEGAGLSPAVLGEADAAVRIPMAPGVDSLNVATATGIALHELALLRG